MLDPKFFLATVVSNEDPDSRGRVRIRIMGIHTEITTPEEELAIGIEEKDLPFAQCLYPVTYTGTGGTCPPPSLQPGDWVLGVSLDGACYQNLMVLGLAKAKFSAEALADGSVNAGDAFASTKTPLSESEASKMADKAEEIQEKHAAADRSSKLQQYNASRGPEYETAAKISNNWFNSASTVSGFGASGGSPMVSTGNAVMNILSSLNSSGSPILDNFRDASGIALNTNAKSESVDNIIEEGYYTYCYEYFNDKTSKKSPVLPTLAFTLGCGTVDALLSSYGDPRTSNISYAQFCNNMANDGKTAEANYFKEVVKELNKNGTSKTSLTDNNLKRFKNHQYRLSSQISSKALRVLGDVVFPTLRSTVTQTQQMLPYYCIEGKVVHEHIGVDLATSEVPILAFADGTVQAAMTTNAKDCNAVVILHAAGVKTLYMHMNKVLVKKGQKVKAGQQIGTGGGAGAKGPNTHHVHLHFAVKKETKLLDPLSFLRKDIGFAVNTISTADHYKKGPLNKTDSAYKNLQKARNADSIVWSF